MMGFAFSRSLWTRCATVAAVAAFLLPGMPVNASQKKQTHPVRKATTHRRVRHHNRYRHHRPSYTRVQLQPERVREIQQALAKAGTLHEDPTGKWDDATRSAMRQYQQENGFSPTGLPEAKPLMKLGLGPHPLPPGISSRPPGNAESSNDSEATTASGPSPEKQPPSSNQ